MKFANLCASTGLQEVPDAVERDAGLARLAERRRIRVLAR